MDNKLLKSKVEPILIALGQFIKQRRLSLRMSQEELAVRSGLHRTYVSDVERGNRNLTLGASTLLANGLNIELRDMILALDHDGLPKNVELESMLGVEQQRAAETLTTDIGFLSEPSRKIDYEILTC